MSGEIRRLEETEYDKWDKLVAESPQGTLFHESSWLEASGEDFGIYGYFKGGELYAGIPFIQSKLKLGIKSFHPPSSTPYFGIVFRKNEGKYVTRISDEKDISRSIAIKLKEDFDSISFDFSPFVTDMQPFVWEGFSSQVKYTYILQYDDLDEVWNGMDTKRRNDITKAEKDGVYVEFCDDFDQTIELVKKTFERQGKLVEFETSVIDYNKMLVQKGRCKSFLAKNKDDKAIGAVYIIWDKKRSYYFLGGYDPEERHHGASAMAVWEAIKFTKNELRLNCFDFEGSMLQPVEQYFRKFGGTLTPYYSVYWMKLWIETLSYAKKSIISGLKFIKSNGK